ncbi:MAG TPA: DUF2807 domain-containing protein [Parafilimonas sp.]|nr:DUF2807 domain-containing protein [Parafilimonas sp.]
MKILNSIQKQCVCTGNACKVVVKNFLSTFRVPYYISSGKKINVAGKLFAIVVIVSMFTSCTKDIVEGNGSVVTAERTVSNFSGVDVSGANKVFVSYAPQITVTLKGYSNLVSHYKTEVNSGTLHLHYDNDVAVRNDNLQVYITMPSFNTFNLSGSCSINATGGFESTSSLSVSTSGNGNINIEKLSTGAYTVSSSGNSEITTLGVEAKTAKVEISGSSAVSLSVQNKLDVHISGNGKVSYKGDPTEINTDISGNGEVIKL